MKQGAPKEKLMIGMPTYGRSFTLVDPSKFDIGAPASGGGTPGKYTGEAGFMSYYEVSPSSSLLNIQNGKLFLKYCTFPLPFLVFYEVKFKQLVVLSLLLLIERFKLLIHLST